MSIPTKLCAKCFGTGTAWVRKGPGWVMLDEQCYGCNGTGWAHDSARSRS